MDEMTREEEIKRASIMYHIYQYDNSYEEGETLDFYIKGFTEGAKWADKHPDISQLWRDAYEEPEIGSNIIVVDKYGQWWEIQPYDGEYDGYGGLTGWECCVAHYNNIQRWAYIDDLLPKTK